MDPVKILNALARRNPKERNVVVSGHSIALLLAMVARGADGVTRQELAAYFGFPSMPEELDTIVKRLVAWHTTVLRNIGDGIQLHKANAVWINKDFASSISPAYAASVAKEFDAAFESGKRFADPSVPTDINDWAAAKTKGLLTEVMKPNELRQDDVAVLLSALYFKGEWARKFDKALTYEAPFFNDACAAVGGGGCATARMVKMMSRYFAEGDKLTHLSTEAYEAVSMCYGREGSDTRIVLVRPKDAKQTAREWLAQQEQQQQQQQQPKQQQEEDDDEDEEAFEKRQNKKLRNLWLYTDKYEPVVGNIELPHIDIQQRHDLVPVMQELGLTSAFSAQADFSKMSATGAKDFYISVMTQDVTFKTDEEGSEAAAVTKCTARSKCLRREPKEVNVRFDRSFVFAVVCMDTVLFAGIVDQPTVV